MKNLVYGVMALFLSMGLVLLEINCTENNGNEDDDGDNGQSISYFEAHIEGVTYRAKASQLADLNLPGWIETSEGTVSYDVFATSGGLKPTVFAGL